ncbi:uncharacterized protein LOC124935363 [Impatiens glandulifera]|uniref:uncharacterized protein LOC124935363 n=1 Tax=Impatiens glandulifera TaxID=253017 RepID=UPI001FB1962A|nr:uncharacterized protein LOC124935363 [Impatiens glandulifera]
MAVDVYPSKSPSLGTSPRISFSHDLIQNCRPAVINDDPSLLDPTFDFDFSTGKTFAFDISLADEIFSNGVILPTEIKPKKETKIETEKPNEEEEEPKPTNKKIMRLKEFLSCNNDETEHEKVPLIKPFWKFKRSSSLNYHHHGSLIRPLQFFSRSKSAGSVAQTITMPVKERRIKQPLMFSRSSSCNSYYPYNSSKRPPAPLKKSFSRSYVDNGIRVSPVLHFSNACIAKGTATLFGLRSLFCNGFGKSRGKRKSSIN